MGDGTIVTGDGDDTISISCDLTVSGALTATTGAGGDNITVTDSGIVTITSMTIDTGSEADTIQIDGAVTAIGNASFTTGGGEDVVTITGSVGASNISINTGGHYRPASLEATGKPALVFIGERDDVWHMDVYRAFVEEVRNAGNPVEIHVLKNSYHSLTAERVYCPQAQQVRACREQVVYTDKGLLVQGRLSTQKEGWRTCGRWGYHCGYGNMELYDDMYTVVVDFLRRAVGSTK